MKKLDTALHCLLLAGAAALCASAQTPPAQPAQDAKTLMVNVVYAHSGGVVRLNGIPINRFGGGHSEGGDTGTLFIGNGLTSYGIDGVNTLTVETKPTGLEADVSTELVVIGADGNSEQSQDAIDHPLFQKKIAGAGTIEYSLTLRNLPHRLFDDAAPWKGDPQAVLTAVQTLHTAFVARDMKTIAAAIRPAFESMADAPPPGSFDAMIAHFGQSLKTSKVAVLPANLKVESFYDGRLFRVTDAQGRAPLRATSIKLASDGTPDEMLELGQFWCYRNGVWLPLAD
jgi:hypothetical protein